MIDGHGGKAAAEFVAENLGKNIVKELERVEKKEGKYIEVAIREGYSFTDQEFLNLVRIQLTCDNGYYLLVYSFSIFGSFKRIVGQTWSKS